MKYFRLPDDKNLKLQKPETGAIVLSKCGHDQGRIYLAVKEDGDFLFLSDGVGRDFSSPKKKRKSHIAVIAVPADRDEWMKQIKSLEPGQSRAEIRKRIQAYMEITQTDNKQ